MFKNLITSILSLTCLQVAIAQDDGEKPKEDLGYAYILPITISSVKSASASEEVGTMIPPTLLVDPSCIPAEISNSEKYKDKPYILRISEYRTSKPILLNKAVSQIIFDALDYDGKPKFKWRIIPPESKEALVLVFSNPNSKKKWVKPTFKVIDCSAKKIPGGSVVVINYSPNELHTQIGKNKYILQKGEKRIFQAPVTEKMALSVTAKNGKRKSYLYRNYIKNKKDYRKIIVVYPNPSSGSRLKVAMSLADIPLIPTQR